MRRVVPCGKMGTVLVMIVIHVLQALDDDEVEWGEDTSEAAVKQRMKDLSDAAKNLAISDDIEKTPQERIDMFYSYVKVTEGHLFDYEPDLSVFKSSDQTQTYKKQKIFSFQ